jgi:hypothetical protein
MMWTWKALVLFFALFEQSHEDHKLLQAMNFFWFLKRVILLNQEVNALQPKQ